MLNHPLQKYALLLSLLLFGGWMLFSERPSEHQSTPTAAQPAVSLPACGQWLPPLLTTPETRSPFERSAWTALREGHPTLALTLLQQAPAPTSPDFPLWWRSAVELAELLTDLRSVQHEALTQLLERLLHTRATLQATGTLEQASTTSEPKATSSRPSRSCVIGSSIHSWRPSRPTKTPWPPRKSRHGCPAACGNVGSPSSSCTARARNFPCWSSGITSAAPMPPVAGSLFQCNWSASGATFSRAPPFKSPKS